MTDTARRAEEAFLDALERPAGERIPFLERELADDPRGLAAARALLSEHECLGEFLERPAGALLDAADGLRSPPVAPGTRVGRYVVEGLLGTGGSGRVHVARQERPVRQVALKFLRGGLISPAAVRRFLDEAELLARLTHPGVAHVYEAGVHEADGRQVPFLALELVEDARDVVTFAAEERLDRSARVALVARVCDAVHHAHQKGVLHLDVKPANVLVDGAGRPKVIDFGIGQERDASDDRRGVVGTLASMSPEQAAGAPDGLDVRADVYALGVLAFELLTGALPIDVAGDEVSAALARIRDESPRRAADLAPGLRGELDAILACALAKDRDARYDSAAALAEDLRRVLRREPVSVIPLTLGYQLRTFARRRKVAALSVLALVVVSVTFAVGATLLAARAERRREEAELNAYVADIAAASAAIAIHDVATARARLEATPRALRQWEWHHLASRLDASEAQVRISGARALRSATSPDGTRIAVFGVRPPNENFVRVMELPAGTQVFEIAVRHDRPVTALAWSADGDLLLAHNDGTVERVGPDGGVRASFRVHDAHVNDLLVLEDRGALLCALRDGSIRGVDLDDGTPRGDWTGHTDRVIALARSPDGARVVSGGREGALRVWDVATGTCERLLEGHDGSVECVTWSRDGRTLVSGGRDATVRFWDVATGVCRTIRREHGGVVRDVAAPAGTALVVSAGWDRTVRMWDPSTGAPRGVLGGSASRVMSLGGGRETDRVWATTEFGVARRFRVAPRSDPPLLAGHADRVQKLAFSPDGTRIVSVAADGRVLLHRVADGTCEGRLETRAKPYGITFVDDGRVLLGAAVPAGDDAPASLGALRVHVHRLSGTGVGRGVVEGGLLAGNTVGDLIRVDSDHGAERVRPGLVPDQIDALAGLPARSAFVAVTATGTIGVWRTAGGPALALRTDGPTGATCVDVAPDERIVAVGTRRGALVFLDAVTLDPVARLQESGAPLSDVAFAPDGRRLATAGHDGLVRVWDVRAEREVARLRHSDETVRCLAWSPDGRVLAAGGGEWESPGTVALWIAPVQKPDVSNGKNGPEGDSGMSAR